MALTTEQIDAEAFTRWGDMKGAPLELCRDFARAIEAEVRKQEDALIKQMLEALEETSPYVNIAHEWKSSEWIAKRAHAITTARARVGENI